MLKLKNVSVIIEKKEILRNISFILEEGFLVVFGKSGSGKSTLLETILGSKKNVKGEILLGEKKENLIDISKLEIKERGIGILFQDLILFPNLTIIENINVGNNTDKELRDRLIKKFGINNLLKKYPHEISGGEAQRVALIRSVINKPKLLLLDEPFSSLDDINREIIKKELKELLTELKIPTIIVSHNRDDIDFFGGNVLYLKNGQIENNK